MPELPEVQAHAERLDREFAGTELTRFRALSFTALKTAAPDPAGAEGHVLERVTHRGKHLVLGVGVLAFVVHLMQGGRLRPDPKQAPKPRGGLARWVFADGRALLLSEAGREHRAGVWCVPVAEAEMLPPLDGLGPDATTVSAEVMAAAFAAHPMRLHGFLRDQRIVAGLGRRLANEVCHRARLSPFAPTARLGPAEAARVVTAIGDAVAEGLAFERTLDDMSSSADRPGHVHRRTGQACPVCGDTVREVAYAAYTVHYCPSCQTGGKVLADNTTSRFVK